MVIYASAPSSDVPNPSGVDRQTVVAAWEAAVLQDDGCNFLLDDTNLAQAQALSHTYYEQRYGRLFTAAQIALLRREHAIAQAVRVAFSPFATSLERIRFQRTVRLMHHLRLFGEVGLDDLPFVTTLLEGLAAIMYGIEVGG